jgi:S-methylmethionine transporter
MISLGGAIGTGLFLGSGEVIAQTGPVGAIISYFLGGIIARCRVLIARFKGAELP